MKATFYQFNFDRYKPRKLEQLAKKVTTLTMSVQLDSQRINFLLKKLRDNPEGLRSSEIRYLCFHIGLIKKEGLFKDFLVVCYSFFSKESRVLYHVRGLLTAFYNDFQDEDLYRLLRYAVTRNTIWKLPLSSFKDSIIEAQDSFAFLEKLKSEFMKCKNKEEILEQKEYFLIQDSGAIYRHLLLSVLGNKIRNMNNSGNFIVVKEIINYFYSNKVITSLKPAIQDFLITQKYREDFENLPYHIDELFKLILNVLGDVYGPTQNRWQGISDEAKRVFILWRTQSQIKYFFGDIIGDKDRLAFWKRYSHHFYRIEYFEKYEHAVLMETKKHLFVEFTGYGSMHMYDLKDLSIDAVKRNPHQYGKTKMVQYVLKNKGVALLFLSHRGRWQWEFDWNLKNYGYSVRR